MIGMHSLVPSTFDTIYGSMASFSEVSLKTLFSLPQIEAISLLALQIKMSREAANGIRGFSPQDIYKAFLFFGR